MNKKNKDRAISTFEFLSQIPDEVAATEFLERKRWGDTPRCPRCGTKDVARTPRTAPMPWRCPDCRKYFNVRTGTVMAATRIPLRKWLYAIYLFHTSRKGVSSLQLSKELGLTYKSAWFLGHRIREAMQFPGPLLDGEVEIDETYFGGKNRWRHGSKKMPNGGPKQVVIGLKQRDTGVVVAFPIRIADRFNLKLTVMDNVEPDCMVYTDGHPGYQNIPAYPHEWVAHSTGEYVRDMAHTNGIESFWSLLKRGYHGTYHYMSFKHLHRYVDEFAHRQSSGTGNGYDVIGDTCNQMQGKRLMYKNLVGPNLA